MKIVCPNCEAAYQVPEAVASSHRPMRCARCKQEWIPGQPEAEEQPPETEADIFDHAHSAGVAPETIEPAVPPPVEGIAEAELNPMAAAPIAADPPLAVLVAPPLTIPEPAPPVAAPPPPLAPAKVRPAVPPPLALELEPSRPPSQPMAAWAASIALVVVLTSAGLAFRGPVMKAWPPSTRLYAAIGLR